MKTEQEIKNQIIQEMIEMYDGYNIEHSDIIHAVDNIYGKCGCCYCYRVGTCCNIKSSKSGKFTENEDSCEEFLHYDAFE